ncbi:hypothetical protein Airi01_054010 [Actinoallomurus iriomotensis]|uniref:Uncharacterized protein n=1 Tax=Actinoallomurus iriomotensis TaxID=478107 RepID=A0A9W6RJW2_9ACTN|nr:hypothetical protein Airi01_054010 [Actinoallomurus iriomotensis]
MMTTAARAFWVRQAVRQPMKVRLSSALRQGTEAGRDGSPGSAEVRGDSAPYGPMRAAARHAAR